MDPFVQYLYEIANGARQFVQPSIDLAGRAMALPGQIISQEAEDPLTMLLGQTGGPPMAGALGDILGPMMAIPQGAGRLEPIGPSRTVPQETPYGYRPTQPLPEIAGEPRFHGSRQPIAEMKPGVAASAIENLYGPGFYTTDDYHVAGGYAGVSGPRYRVHEIGPTKFLGANEPIPEIIRSRLASRTQNAGWFDPGLTVDKLFHETRWYHDMPLDAVDQFIRAAQEEGYSGIQHQGGGRTGGPAHDVKVYWSPERDIRIRPVAQDQYGPLPKIAPPIVGK